MKRIFSSCLALLFILMISSCAGAYNDYKETEAGSVSFNVGQIVHSALQAKRSVSRDAIAEENDPEGGTTIIEPWDCIKAALEFKISSIEGKTEKVENIEKYPFDFKQFYGIAGGDMTPDAGEDEILYGEEYLKSLFEDKNLEVKIPVGKTVRIKLEISFVYEFDEDMLEQMYNTQFEQAPAEYKPTYEEFKEEILSHYTEGYDEIITGISDEITIKKGLNYVTIRLFDEYSLEEKYYVIYLKGPADDDYKVDGDSQYLKTGDEEEEAEDEKFIKAVQYYTRATEHYSLDTEKSDTEWQEDTNGNSYKRLYFYYDANLIIQNTADGIDAEENSYKLFVYGKKDAASGTFFVLRNNNFPVSYGDWKKGEEDGDIIFTEKLYYKNSVLALTDNSQTVNVSESFIFTSTNGTKVTFAAFDTNGGGGTTEGTKYYYFYLWNPDSEDYVTDNTTRVEYTEDSGDAKLKEYEYRYLNPAGYYREDMENDWRSNGNFEWKKVYYSYAPDKKTSVIYTAEGTLSGNSNKYNLALFGLTKGAYEGTYIIEDEDGDTLSIGGWAFEGADSSNTISFTEYLTHDPNKNCIIFAENATPQSLTISEAFTFKTSKNVSISFGTLKEYESGGSGGGGDPTEETSISGAGTISPQLPETFEILESISEGTNYFLNKGKIQFSLRDSTNENIVEASNVDWDYELRYGSTVIPDDGTYYTHETAGTLEIINLPASGTYRLYVEITPNNPDYENYEMASYVSEYNITAAYYEYNVSDATADNYLSIDDDYETDPAFEALAAAMSKSNVYLKLSGQVATSYGNHLYHIKDICNSSYTLYLDIENLTAGEAANEMAYGLWDDWSRLTGITLPAVVTALECYDSSEHYSIFYNCPELQTVKFPNPQNWYVSSCRLVGDDLLNVDWDEELTQINVYNQETNAENLTSNWGYLYQRTE